MSNPNPLSLMEIRKNGRTMDGRYTPGFASGNLAYESDRGDGFSYTFGPTVVGCVRVNRRSGM